jgi:hypothetical protein
MQLILIVCNRIKPFSRPTSSNFSRRTSNFTHVRGSENSGNSPNFARSVVSGTPRFSEIFPTSHARKCLRKLRNFTIPAAIYCNLLQLFRHARRRLLSTIAARPSGVRGPVDSPPCNRQRRRPGTTRARHGCPLRVVAPQRHRDCDGLGAFHWTARRRSLRIARRTA